jgi:hypothetical protein
LKTEHIKAIAFRVAVLVIAMLAYPAYAQYEVAEIPFFNTPKGTAALGCGVGHEIVVGDLEGGAIDR